MKVLIVSEYENGPGAAVASHRLAKALADRLDENPAPGREKVSYAFRFAAQAAAPMEHCARHHVGEKSAAEHKPLPLRVHQYLSYKETISADPGKSVWRPMATASARFCLRRYYARCESDLRGLIARGKFDVVNFHNVSMMLDHSFVTEISQQVPVFWTMHDCHAARLRAYKFNALDGSPRTNPRTLLTVHRDTRQRMMRDARHLAFIAPSRWMAAVARDVYGSRFPIHHVPYGLDARDFFPIPASHARTLLNLASSEELTLLFIASSLENERKNLRVLLDALALIPQLPVRLLCLGEAVRTEIKDDRVMFLGRKSTVEELRTAYSAADVSVVTSLIDNLPNTVLESLFCGTPVIGAKAGGIPDMVREGRTGWLFDPRSPQQLADRIREVFFDRAMIAAVAENCAMFARRRFSRSMEAERYERLFIEARGKFQGS
ncbi:glycosyltransferase [Candidatus Sumerlaeota bacterium]|nr:glycosyltransferase [Candidatus Sumerlaeota bacterium]